MQYPEIITNEARGLVDDMMYISFDHVTSETPVIRALQDAERGGQIYRVVARCGTVVGRVMQETHRPVLVEQNLADARSQTLRFCVDPHRPYYDELNAHGDQDRRAGSGQPPREEQVSAPQLPPIDRQGLIAEARAIVEILDRGGYDGPAGYVNIHPELVRLTVGTRHYSAGETQALGALPATQHAAGSTRISVTRETTLAAAQRLLNEHPGPVAALNFASATTPGGGFLSGSAAQEESLARASGLYHALQKHPEYYAAHQGFGECLYSDRMLFSRDVPIFRDAAGSWLDRLWHLDILTAAAPNLRRLTEVEMQRVTPEAQAALAQRAELVLALFAHHRCTRLVLGAWGCGAFRNDPEHVASIFARLLQGPYAHVFDEVVFAVFATPAEERNFRAFERHLLR